MSDGSWHQLQALHEIYKDRLREAERARLLGQVPQDLERRHRRAHRVATWLRQRLATWVGRQQERFAAGAVGAGGGVQNPGPASGCATASCRE